jgi:hypothetical protein
MALGGFARGMAGLAEVDPTCRQYRACSTKSPTLFRGGAEFEQVPRRGAGPLPDAVTLLLLCGASVAGRAGVQQPGASLAGTFTALAALRGKPRPICPPENAAARASSFLAARRGPPSLETCYRRGGHDHPSPGCTRGQGLVGLIPAGPVRPFTACDGACPPTSHRRAGWGRRA